MRISDWSSDVCSSDLPATNLFPADGAASAPEGADASRTGKVPAIGALTPNGSPTAALSISYASCCHGYWRQRQRRGSEGIFRGSGKLGPRQVGGSGSLAPGRVDRVHRRLRVRSDRREDDR